MNETEKEDAAIFTIELCAETDLAMNETRRFNRIYLFLQDIYYDYTNFYFKIEQAEADKQYGAGKKTVRCLSWK